ncbi:MAG TPA: hypothetical protein VGS07_01270 [Thermoanaerobaculia bacterium]|nr:hypothetical protein [Thermoanaerobaculia bacterium]
MRGFIIFLLVIGVVGWGVKSYLKSHDGSLSLDRLANGSPEEAAKTRVKAILEGLKTDGDTDGLPFQTSICQWDSAVGVIQDRTEFEQAYDAFDIWRSGFDINHRKISGYVITGSEVVQEKPPVVMVSGTIENRPFKMRVPDKRRVSWVN